MTQQGESIKRVVTFKQLIKYKYFCHYQELQNHLNAKRRCIISIINITPHCTEGMLLKRGMVNGFLLS